MSRIANRSSAAVTDKAPIQQAGPRRAQLNRYTDSIHAKRDN
jgi:hypothetical protein